MLGISDPILVSIYIPWVVNQDNTIRLPWSSPILSWPRILFSKRGMLWFSIASVSAAKKIVLSYRLSVLSNWVDVFDLFHVFHTPYSPWSRCSQCSPSVLLVLQVVIAGFHNFWSPGWCHIVVNSFICKGEPCVHYLAIVEQVSGLRPFARCKQRTSSFSIIYKVIPDGDPPFIDSSDFPSWPRSSMIFLALMLGNFPHALLADFGENVSCIRAPSDSLRPDHPTNLTFMELESL